jgi:peptide/nickel transport system substrate-binding protein
MAVGAGCGGGSDSANVSGPAQKFDPPASAQDQSIVVASYSEANSLDPQATDDDAQYPVLWRVYESLVDFDREGNVVPLLAAELPKRIDDTTWEVDLLPDVTFSDGQPFTADSAVASIERIIDPDYGSQLTEIETIKGAEKVDADTIRITTKAADPLLPYRLRSVKMLPENLPDFNADQANGTGPYMLASYKAASQAELVSNPEYRGDQPPVTNVTVRFIPDPGTRVQALKAGELDLMLGLLPDQMASAPKVIQTLAGTNTGLVRINAHAGILADARVRQALNYAIDSATLTENLFAGTATPANCQPAPPQAGNTNPALEPYPYDPEKAKQLIEAAGATGKPVDVSWSTGVFTQDRAIGEAVAEYWRDAGLDVNLKIQPYNPWLKDIYTSGPKAPELTYTETDNSLNNIDRQVFTFYHTKGAVNTYDDPGLDQEIEQAESTLDDAERQQLYDAILKKTCDDAALVFLYFRKELLGASADLDYAVRSDVASKLYYDQMYLAK